MVQFLGSIIHHRIEATVGAQLDVLSARPARCEEHLREFQFPVEEAFFFGGSQGVFSDVPRGEQRIVECGLWTLSEVYPIVKTICGAT